MLGVALEPVQKILTTAELEEALRSELHDQLVPDTIAARLIGTSPDTMRRWRQEGRGPRYVKIGSNVRYKLSWLREFVAQCVVETSDTARSHEACA